MKKGKIRVAETGEELVTDVLDDVIEEYALKKQPKSDALEACLKAYTKKNLLKLADENDFDVKKSWTKDPIIECMSEEIMDSIEERLSELDEGELNVLKDIANGRAREDFTEDEAKIYAEVYPKAVRMGILYLADEDDALITTMPAEIKEVLDGVEASGSNAQAEEADVKEETEEKSEVSTETHAQEEASEPASDIEAQVDTVLKAGVNLYGYLTVDRVKELFEMQYPDADFDAEVLETRVSELGYYFVEGELIGHSIFQNESNVQNHYDDLQANMGEHYYKPTQLDIEYYADNQFDRRSFLYKSLERFVSQKAFDVKETMGRVERGIQLGDEPALVVRDIVEDGHLDIDSKKEFSDFLHSYINVHNISRMWDKAGYTPKEMSDELGRMDAMETYNPAAVPEMEELDAPELNFEDVGRNDPCPCGSGKKYKKCHMKKNR